MDKHKERDKREAYIMYGFCLEAFFFILTGIFFAFGSWWSIIFLFLAFALAYIVGLQIRENVLENHKWGLD